MSATGITKVVPADLGASPAAVNRKTGVMYVNTALLKRKGVNKDQLFFIMLHELGHVVQQTKSEINADDWAFEQYVKHGGSLKQSVRAVTDWLRFDKKEDFVRANLQLQRAKTYDSKNESFTGNTNKNSMSYKNLGIAYGFGGNQQFTEYFSGKTLPYVNGDMSGFDWGSVDWGGVISGAGQATGAIIAGTKKQPTNTGINGSVVAQQQIAAAAEAKAEAEAKAAAEKKKNQQIMIAVGAGIVVVLVTVLVFFRMRKK